MTIYPVAMAATVRNERMLQARPRLQNYRFQFGTLIEASSEYAIDWIRMRTEWTSTDVIVPLVGLSESGSIAQFEETAKAMRQRIRDKVLESYNNGCKVGAGAVRNEVTRAEAQTR